MKIAATLRPNQTAEAGALVKVKRGLDGAAWEAARKNGADDVRFVSDAGDVYIASGKGFEKLKLQQGNMVEFNGVKGRVLNVDDEANTFGEGLKQIAFQGTIFTATVTGMVGMLGGSITSLFGVPAAGPVLGGLAFLGCVGAIAFACKPHFNFDALKVFGQPIDG